MKRMTEMNDCQRIWRLNMTTQVRLLLASTFFLISMGAATAAHAEGPEKDAGPVQQTEEKPPYKVDLAEKESPSLPEWKRWDNTTLVVQGLTGVGAGVVGAVVVGSIVANTCEPQPNDDFGCLGETLVGGAFGGALSSSIGVWAAGAALGGDGSLWLTMLSSTLTGALAYVPSLLPTLGGTGGAILGIGAFASLTTLGGIVGYHLSSSRFVMPQVGLAPTDGGMALSIGIEF